MKTTTLLASLLLFIGIRANATLSVTTNVLANVSCHGGSNGSASATPSGGTSPYTYSWAPGSLTSSTITGLTAGIYTVTVTDHLGLTATATATITQPTALMVSAYPKFSSICPGARDSLFSSASGGTPPYTYSWTAPFSDLSCSTCQNTNSIPYGSPYVVTAITDKTGCSATASVNITVHPFPYVTILGPINPIAPGRSDTLAAIVAGSATYLWSNSSTKSAIVVSPSVSTTYTVKATNTYGCYDSAHYTIDTDRVGNGRSSSSPIRIVPSSSFTTQSFSTLDSVVWFSFVPTDSNNQIIANSAFLGYPVPHVHRLTLFNSSLNSIVDEPMPDIQGANQIRIDISHLHPGSTYYVRASRSPAHSNMAGCNPTGDVCNATQRWSFQMAFRTVPVFVPNDSASEPPAMGQLYYESRGQIGDLNSIPRFDIKAYTNFASPAVLCSDSAISFVYERIHKGSATDTVQRVDMELTGTAIQPTQPVFKMEEDSGAGYLNYFLGDIENGMPKIEGYSRLVYKNVYPNVDMQVYSNNEGTKLYFVCNPAGTGGTAGNPANIELKFKGANSITLQSDSGLNIGTDFGNISFAPGFAYTDSAGVVKAKSWHANFEVVSSNVVRFHTGAYNTNEPLVIEVDRGHNTSSVTSFKNIHWSMFFGGDGPTGAVGSFNDVTHDASNNIYTTGYTTSPANYFPVTAGAVQDSLRGGKDAIVVKFDSADQRLWATYYGGSNDDIGNSIGVLPSGSVFVTGTTYSRDLVTKNPGGGAYYQDTLKGWQTPTANVFMLKLNAAGSIAKWATYYGGSGYEQAYHLAINNISHMVYVVGAGAYTAIDIQTEPGAYNTGTGAGLIAKFDTNGVRKWGMQIGVPGYIATLTGCAIDVNGNFYITGQVYPASGYPVTSGGFNLKSTNWITSVVTKFNTHDTIEWSTYYGGDGITQANAIAVDGAGNAYITGITYCPWDTANIELMRDGSKFYQGTNGQGGGNSQISVDNENAFIAEFGTVDFNLQLVWGTYFGGNGYLDPYAITLDANNNLYVAGSTDYASNPGMIFPSHQPSGAYVNTNNSTGDAFLSVFDNWGYYWGTYFGGGFNDDAYGLTVAGTNLYLVGTTGNSAPYYDFPWQQLIHAWNQNYDFSPATSIAFITEFGLNAATGINEINSNLVNGEIKVFPNPTTGNVTAALKLEEPQDVEFILYNLFGEPVYSENAYEPAGIVSKQISLSSLSNGNYILQVKAGNTIYHAKITKLQ